MKRERLPISRGTEGEGQNRKSLSKHVASLSQNHLAAWKMTMD